MDLQKFLSLQRKQLEQDRQRLSAVNNSLRNDYKNEGKVETSPCPAALLMQTENFVPGQCQRRMANTITNAGGECNEPHNASTSALATANQNSELQIELELGLSESEQDVEEATAAGQDGETKPASTAMIKSAKEFVNQRELLVGSARQYKSPNASHRSLESERPQSENRLPMGRQKKAVGWCKGGSKSGCAKYLVISMFTLDWRNAKNCTSILVVFVLSIIVRNSLRLVEPTYHGFPRPNEAAKISTLVVNSFS